MRFKKTKRSFIKQRGWLDAVYKCFTASKFSKIGFCKLILVWLTKSKLI
jgi:hypothetical protein